MMSKASSKIQAENPVVKGELILIAPSDVLIDQDWNSRDEVITEESVSDLIESIRTNGQIQPVVLRRERDGRARVIAGFRRVVAGLALQREDANFRLKAVVAAVNDEEAFILSIEENRERKDVSPLCNAVNMRRLIDAYGWDVARVAALYRVSEGYVRLLLRILTLPMAVRRKITAGEISINQAQNCLIRLSDDDVVKAVEEAELDVAMGAEGNGGKTAKKMTAALRAAARGRGVVQARNAKDVIKLLSGRADGLSVALVSYIQGHGTDSDLLSALDAADTPVCTAAEYTAPVTATPDPMPDPGPDNDPAPEPGPETAPEPGPDNDPTPATPGPDTAPGAGPINDPTPGPGTRPKGKAARREARREARKVKAKAKVIQAPAQAPAPDPQPAAPAPACCNCGSDASEGEVVSRDGDRVRLYCPACYQTYYTDAPDDGPGPDAEAGPTEAEMGDAAHFYPELVDDAGQEDAVNYYPELSDDVTHDDDEDDLDRQEAWDREVARLDSESWAALADG